MAINGAKTVHVSDFNYIYDYIYESSRVYDYIYESYKWSLESPKWTVLVPGLFLSLEYLEKRLENHSNWENGVSRHHRGPIEGPQQGRVLGMFLKARGNKFLSFWDGSQTFVLSKAFVFMEQHLKHLTK